MRIAFICTEKLPSPAIKGGAIQVMIDGVLPHLTKTHQLTVVSIRDPKLPRTAVIKGVRYVRFPQTGYRNYVASWLKKQQFDLVHVFNRPQNATYYKSKAPHLKYVVSLHNEMFHPTKMTHSQGAASLRAVKRVLTVSNFMARTVTSRFPYAKSNVQTCYSGVDVSKFLPQWHPQVVGKRERIRQKLGLNSKKVILFAGRLSVKKGPHLLIRAMPAILKKYPDAVLVIAGGKWFSDNSINDYVASLHRMAKPFGSRVRFTNFIPAEQIHEYFWAADVFVCSSQWQEPLARVHYEAMAAGAPIVTTARGGNPEVIRNGVDGLVIHDYQKPSAFATAICKVFADPDRARDRAIKARQSVITRFSFAHVSKRLESAYRLALQVPKTVKRTSTKSHPGPI